VGQDWSTSNTYVWTPMKPSGSYQVEVWVRSAGSTVDSYTVYGSMAFPIHP